ncbi:MAG: hypothetical protein WCO43_09800 [Chitinophagia bacterium]
MKHLYLAVLFISLYLTAISQPVKIKRNQLLNYLLFNIEEIQDVNSNHEKGLYLAELSENDKNLQYDRQIFIKSKKNLYLLLEGTGRVYLATNVTDDHITFQRIDSSLYSGYNYLSINFCYRDTLFSVGGYGFWKFNGQLRYFTNHQWSILPINKEIPLINHLTYINLADSKIFSIGYDYPNEAEINSENKTLPTQVICTNLLKRQNTVLGNINPDIKNIHAESYILWKSDQLKGLIIAYNHNVYLLNFEKNKILKAKTGKISDQLMANIQYIPGYIFQNLDTVFFVKNTDKDKLFHFTISQSDFEKEGIPIYIETKSTFQLNEGLVIFLIITSIVIIFWTIKRKKQANNIHAYPNQSDTTTRNTSGESDSFTFSEFEKQIIQNIIQENLVSVDALNKILGVGKKSLEIQKKSRNDVIHRINHKFKILCEVETDFIERIRSEEDKRYFKYHINKQNEQIYINLIKNHTASQK